MRLWLLIASLIILGGILSTLGDFLGTKIGKARLSIFKLRPRRTAVLITIITGSFISSISLSLLYFIDKQLDADFFRLKVIRSEVNGLVKQRDTLLARIKKGQIDLENLEKGLIALRKGQVVINSGESLAFFTIQINDQSQIKGEIEKMLRIANYNAYRKIKPGEAPKRRLLLVTKEDVKRLESTISDKSKWVVNIRSGRNVLLGENYIYAFLEASLNKKIVNKGDAIASKQFSQNELRPKVLDRQIKLLLTSTLAEVKRRGSLVSEINVDSMSVNNLRNDIRSINDNIITIESISLKDSESADSISVKLSLKEISD